jgi:mannosyltransferase OCH1-like enzyme
MFYYILFIIAAVIAILLIIQKIYFIHNNVVNIHSNSALANIPSAPQKHDSEIIIPKIIIQTWKTNSVPIRYLNLVESIKQNNPSYKYLFFTDSDIEIFLKMYYPEYHKIYLTLPIKIQRIDFFRYIAVYHYGGFYMDMDMNCSKSFDDLLQYSCIFPVDEFILGPMCKIPRYKNICEKGQYFLLGQYAFAASPKHPFIKKIIDIIHENVDSYVKNVTYDNHDYIYKTTGPDFVTNVYIDYPNKEDIFILNNGKRQYFGDYAIHNYFGTWK